MLYPLGAYLMIQPNCRKVAAEAHHPNLYVLMVLHTGDQHRHAAYIDQMSALKLSEDNFQTSFCSPLRVLMSVLLRRCNVRQSGTH